MIFNQRESYIFGWSSLHLKSEQLIWFGLNACKGKSPLTLVSEQVHPRPSPRHMSLLMGNDRVTFVPEEGGTPSRLFKSHTN